MTRNTLFEATTVGGLRLRNRIAMAPMTRERAWGGVPTEEMADYYRRRARGGVGLIITEGIATSLEGSYGADVPRLDGKDEQAGWRRIVDAVQAEGATIFAQLWHVGAFTPALIGMPESLPADIRRLSPSGLAAPRRPLGMAMSDADVEETVLAFASAAANAAAANFNGVEIHAAHGYLPDQFLWSGTNRRLDRWGDRLAFLVAIVKAVRRSTPPGFIISVRLSQWKQLDYAARIAETPEELEAIVTPLAEASVDLFHCSTRRFWEPGFAGDARPLSAWMRQLSGRPVIAVGSVTLDTDFKAAGGREHAGPAAGHIDLLERGLAEGWFDLIAVGRALIANPDWPRLVAAGRAAELRPFDKSMLTHLQ